MSGTVLKLCLFLLILFFNYPCFASNVDTPNEENIILLGMSAAFKGPTGGLGKELYRGSNAYLQYINEKGGINGKKIIIRTYDDGYNPIPTIKNTIQLIEHDKVFALFNYVGTPTVTRILPILKANKDNHFFLFFPFTGALPHRTYPYSEFVFNLRTSYENETSGLVDKFLKMGINKIGIFYQADAYGRSGWDGIRKNFAKKGLKLSAETTYRRGAKYNDSFKKQIAILKEAGVEAVISVGAYAACAGFIRDARDMDWHVPIANVSFVGSEFLISILLEEEKYKKKSYTHNLVFSQVVPSYEDTTLKAVIEYRHLMDLYDSKPNHENIPLNYGLLKYTFVSFEGFLNAKVIVEIIKRMGNNPKREDIKRITESIKDLDIGIDEKISFSKDNHQGLHKVYYTTYMNGKLIPIKDWKDLVNKIGSINK